MRRCYQSKMFRMSLERISIELTNRCGKACWFCYNHSLPEGETRWELEEVVAFVRDCAAHGVKAVSFGGGEPLQYAGLFVVLTQLDGVLFRSITTNGLLLQEEKLEQLRAKSKKLYFIQPIKELITDGSASPRPFLEDDEELPPAKLRRRQTAKDDREEAPVEEYSDDVSDRDFDLSDMGMGDGEDD